MKTIKRIALSLIPGLIVMVAMLILAFILNDKHNAWYIASTGGVLFASGWYVALTYWKDYGKKPVSFFAFWTLMLLIPLLVIRNWSKVEISHIVFSMGMFWNSFVLKYFIITIVKKNKSNS